MLHLGEQFQVIYTKTVNAVGYTTRYLKSVEECTLFFKQIYFEIIDTISNQIVHLIELLNYKCYNEYKTKIPNIAFNSLKHIYGDIIDYTRLINELTVLYRSIDFKDKEMFELFAYLKKYELDETLNEIYKLCSLIVSIPYTTASVERSFSTLKRVKNYARNTMGEDRLSALALTSIETEFLK